MFLMKCYLARDRALQPAPYPKIKKSSVLVPFLKIIDHVNYFHTRDIAPFLHFRKK